MDEKILFVDDDENILASYKRNLRKDFKVFTAPGGEQGLNTIKESGPFAVVVSDMQMPGMKGSEFLAEVNKISPDSIRIMLTGFANIDNAIDAVNKGHIFRFLTKPCESEDLSQTLNEGIRQYNLIHAEKDLLEKTLRNSVNVLTSILGMVNPAAFGRASRVQTYVTQIAQMLKLNNIWQLDMAAMLSQIGLITLPSHILEKVYKQEILTEQEQNLFDKHAGIAAELVRTIPRLEIVSEIIKKQNMNFVEHNINSSQVPIHKFIALGAQILKVVLGFDEKIVRGLNKSVAMNLLRKDQKQYNPRIVELLENVQISEQDRVIKELPLSELKATMIACENVMSKVGKLLVARDTVISEPLIQKLLAYDKSVGVVQPIKIKI